jgi:hypothetical protein
MLVNKNFAYNFALAVDGCAGATNFFCTVCERLGSIEAFPAAATEARR